jgi:hypothetical protein
MANYDEVAPWVVVLVIVFTIGRTCIGFPDWLRQRLGSDKR